MLGRERKKKLGRESMSRAHVRGMVKKEDEREKRNTCTVGEGRRDGQIDRETERERERERERRAKRCISTRAHAT